MPIPDSSCFHSCFFSIASRIKQAMLKLQPFPLQINNEISYRLTNWMMFLCGQIQSPRPDVMPDRREGIARAEGFVASRTETSSS